MKVLICFMLVLGSVLYAQESIVRVYCSWDRLGAISSKYDLDIAAGRANEWYDLVADRGVMDRIIASGIPYEVTVPSLELEKDEVRAEYHSYAEITQILRDMANDYPTICKFDSLPIRTYQGNWIYGVKISDDPGVEDVNEPGFLIDGQHHSREWACSEVVLFFADSILRSYGIVSDITQIVNGTEIYCFPVINVDGYLYDYPGQNWWRKNREPFGGSIGTDPNRNYPGCSPDIEGDWGAVDDGQATHEPSQETFCGAYANSGDETRSLAMFVRSHIINSNMSYHSYAELLMWGWGWTTSGTPDNTVCARFGNRMAGMISSLGGGTYGGGQIPIILYPVSGSSIDWIYSWCHYLGGIANLSYTTELGTSFYQPEGDLDEIIHENFDALKYLAILTRDSIPPLCEGCVAPPQAYPIGDVASDFTVAWHAVNPTENHPTHWELVELTNPSVIEDNLESGTGRWVLDGFTLSTTYSHSATHSFFSGNVDDMNNAVRTLHPYLVQSGDSVTFWCRYQLEPDYDVAVVEVSENTKAWYNLDTTRFNGNQTTWVRRAYSLANWVGKSVYIRFRSMTDGNTLNGGFYVDDISPACLFANVTTVSSSIYDTLYQITGHAMGDYYYYVRGNNTAWGWGEYSTLKKASVVIGIAERPDENGMTVNPSMQLSPNPFRAMLDISYVSGNTGHRGISIKIYDASGRLVKSFEQLARTDSSPLCVTWDGHDDTNNLLPPGIYFVVFRAGENALTGKILKY